MSTPKPTRLQHVITTEDKYTLPVYSKKKLALERGEGCWVWDTDGNRYLDFYGGHAVAMVGHCHPHVVEAIREQAGKLLFYSNTLYLETRAAAAESLARFTEWRFPRSFFVNSGAEAAEVAIKIAYRATGRTSFVALKNSWHGRTLGALSITGVESSRRSFDGLLGPCRFIECGDLEALEKALDHTTAAFFAEPVMSMAGVVNAEAEFYQKAQELCRKHGALYVSDEIQCGWGRTGLPFGFDHYGVEPDMLIAAKGLAGGLPVGAVLCTEAVSATTRTGDHGTTFGGGPLVCAAISATLEVVKSEDLVVNAARQGEFLRRELTLIPGVRQVTGKGLLLGIETDKPTAGLLDPLKALGVLAGGSQMPHRMRAFPPLTVNREECQRFVEAFSQLPL